MDKQQIKTQAKQRIDELFGKLEKMEQKRDQVKAELKDSYSQHLENLKAKKKELQSRFQHLEQVTEDKWNEAEKDFQDSSKAFSDGVSKLTSIIS